ncbi:MAG: phenylacetate--CoA ligase [Candidatus Sumerlaeia bacterium]|nr:phenylacetate--CoA ligase [Candidatus Sumerlaeia bacterium]
MNIWDPAWEQIDRATLERHQGELLREQVRRAAERLPYVQARLNAAGLRPADIRGLDDLRRLPFTVKQDFMDHYPFGMIAVPLREVVRVHGSSGTSRGKSTIVGYTRRDLDTWSELCARLATAAGVTASDIAQISFGYGLFTGGFGLHAGLERVGALVLPISSGNTPRQVQFLRDFGTTALVGTPTYALHIAETAREMGIERGQLALKWGLFGGEPWSEAVRRQIESLLGIVATDNYGLSELCGPGVSYECLCKNGMHIAEDHYIVEVLDPKTLEPVADGEVGELVFTTLMREAVPLIRYRTGDLASVTREPCACGRTLARMSKVVGRTDDMMVIRGVNVFPSQIESILLDIEHTQPHYQIVRTRKGALEHLEVRVEVTEALFNDEIRHMRAVEEEIREALRSGLGVDVDVRLVEPKSLERFTGKARRVVDERPSDTIR